VESKALQADECQHHSIFALQDCSLIFQPYWSVEHVGWAKGELVVIAYYHYSYMCGAAWIAIA